KSADTICHSIARELSQLRHRAVAANVSVIADVAGAMSVLATRAGNLNMKIRTLTDGVNNLKAQLDHALTAALRPERKGPEQPRPYCRRFVAAGSPSAIATSSQWPGSTSPSRRASASACSDPTERGRRSPSNSS